MYRSFYELTKDELDDLRETYRWNHYEKIGIFCEEITNEMLKNEYGDILFVDEDFCCNALNHVEEEIKKLKQQKEEGK